MSDIQTISLMVVEGGKFRLEYLLSFKCKEMDTVCRTERQCAANIYTNNDRRICVDVYLV